MANWKEQFRLFNGTTPLTGQSANLSFRISPYASDIGGLTFTESPASSANYLCSGFSAYYKDAKLFLSGVEQTAFGIKNIGDPEDNFVSLSQSTPAQTIQSRVDFVHGSGLKTDIIDGYSGSGAGTLFTIPVVGGKFSRTNFIETDTLNEKTVGNGIDIDGVNIKDNIYTGHTGRALLAEANTLIVDANRATDLTGYVYNTIQEAIDYAQSQTPSGSSRWTIFIVPHKNCASYLGYAESLTLYKFIDLIGLGMIMMRCVFTYSGTWTGGTYARHKNLFVKPLDDTNLTVRGVESDNCHYGISEDSLTPTLSLENSQFQNCGFWKYGTVTNAIATTGGNSIMNCLGNSAITWDATDDVWSYDYINDTSKIFKLT